MQVMLAGTCVVPVTILVKGWGGGGGGEFPYLFKPTFFICTRVSIPAV